MPQMPPNPSTRSPERADTIRWLVCAAVMAINGCERTPSSPSNVSSPSAASASGNAASVWFQEQASQRGINFRWQSGHQGRYLFPESIGGGAALFDMDNDGDLDAYLVQGGSLADPTQNGPDVLMRNRGDGTFEDASAGLPPTSTAYGMGVACGDYDNDADIDLYITSIGRNMLYRNDGGGSFSDVTDVADVGHTGWGSSAAFLDYDNDGDLDLYACNYVNWSIATELDCFNNMGAPDYCSPNNYSAPAMDVLYRNNGDGTFADVTIQAGLDAYFGNGLGVVCGDFNRDGWIDIFVANDGMRNQLWANQGNGTFLDVGLQTGCALDLEGKAKAGMGTTATDLDDDGDLDILVCNLKRESDSVFINEGTHFSDETTSAGLRVATRPFTRFGLGAIDFDNDGCLDLYEANGLVMREDQVYSTDPYAQPSLLFRGVCGSGVKFQEVQPRGGTAELLVATSRAAAFGDVDNDGGVDILVVNRDAPAFLLRNVVPQRGHWIMMRVLDEHGRDAYGAIVTMKLGERTITRPVRAAYSYLASNDPRVHVGLGKLDRVDEVTVRWVDGAMESFGSLSAGRIHTLKRGGGR